MFSLDGRVDLDISFNGITMRTPIYIKVEAADKLLLGEGVCRQFKIITYHPLVSSKKTRKENKVRPMPSVKPHNVGGEAADQKDPLFLRRVRTSKKSRRRKRSRK